jgi:hypothetical protein
MGGAVTQLRLDEWTPPPSDRFGSTYDAKRDFDRLNTQQADVWAVFKDGEWHTLRSLSERTGHPEASISARIRDFRKPRFGGHTVEREYVERGLFRYRVVG